MLLRISILTLVFLSGGREGSQTMILFLTTSTSTIHHLISISLPPSPSFLGPRGPLVLPLIGPARPSALKIWITYIQAYMPYES